MPPDTTSARPPPSRRASRCRSPARDTVATNADRRSLDRAAASQPESLVAACPPERPARRRVGRRRRPSAHRAGSGVIPSRDRAPRARRQPRAVRGRRAARRRRHGRSVPGPRREAPPRRGGQGAPGRARRRPGEAAPLRQRGARRCRDQPPERPRRLRRRDRRHALRRLRAARGRDVAREPLGRRGAARARDRDRDPGRARPRRRARQGHRPPRPQARQRLPHARRPGEDSRLRPRPRPRRAERTGADERAHARPHGGRHDPRDERLHVPEQVRGLPPSLAATSSRSASCSTRCSRASAPSRARRSPTRARPSFATTPRGGPALAPGPRPRSCAVASRSNPTSGSPPRGSCCSPGGGRPRHQPRRLGRRAALGRRPALLRPQPGARPGVLLRRARRGADRCARPPGGRARRLAHLLVPVPRHRDGRARDRREARRRRRARGQRATRRRAPACGRPARRRGRRLPALVGALRPPDRGRVRDPGGDRRECRRARCASCSPTATAPRCRAVAARARRPTSCTSRRAGRWAGFATCASRCRSSSAPRARPGLRPRPRRPRRGVALALFVGSARGRRTCSGPGVEPAGAREGAELAETPRPRGDARTDASLRRGGGRVRGRDRAQPAAVGGRTRLSRPHALRSRGSPPTPRGSGRRPWRSGPRTTRCRSSSRWSTRRAAVRRTSRRPDGKASSLARRQLARDPGTSARCTCAPAPSSSAAGARRACGSSTACLRGQGDPSCYDNAACVYARAGNREEAIAALEECVRAGWYNRTGWRTTPTSNRSATTRASGR